MDEKIIINPRTPAKKATKLRVIDEGNNRYDVAGKLIQLGRAIRAGKYEKVTDVIVGVRQVRRGELGAGVAVTAFHFGQGDEIAAFSTIDRMKAIIVGE